MAYRLKIKSSNRGSGFFCYSDDVWDMLLTLDNGSYLNIANKIILKTTTGRFLTITKGSGEIVKQLSSTASVDISHFITHIGLMDNGTSFLIFEWKDLSRNNEILIGSIYGGLAGTVVHLEVDFNNVLPDFKIPNIAQVKKEKKTIDEYSIPVQIGQSKIEINQILQVCETETRGDRQWFYDIGVMVEYKNDIIECIHIAKFIEGRLSNDYIFGISIGDSYSECVLIWGQPITKYMPIISSYFAFWFYKGYKIKVELWNEDSDKTDPWFPNCKKDTVRSITLSKEL